MEILCVNLDGHKEGKSGHRIFCWDCRRIIRIRVGKHRRGKKSIAYLIHRDGDCCKYCNEPFSETNRPTVDHVIPKSMGGPDRLTNKVLACHSCNQKKGNKPLKEFLAELKRAGKVAV